MSRLKVITLLVGLAAPLPSVAAPVVLECSGEVTCFACQELAKARIDSVIVVLDVERAVVELQGFALEGQYKIVQITDAEYHFRADLSLDQKRWRTYVGTLNRYSGKMLVTNDASSFKELWWHVDTECRRTEKQF